MQGRIYNPSLFDKATTKDGEQFQFVLVWLKKDSAELNKLVREAIKTIWDRKPSGLNLPILDGDNSEWDEYRHCHFATFSNENAISVTGNISSGDEVKIEFEAVAYDKGKADRGVKFIAKSVELVNKAGAVTRGSLANIPSELKALDQWLVWRYNKENAKIPVNAKTGYPGSTVKPSDWATYDRAESEFITTNRYTGVGFVFSPKDEYVGVDLDKCRDAKTGEVAPWAEKIIEDLDTYTEISPSGTGFKMWLKAELPPGYRNKSISGQIECYSESRYFACTGNCIGDPKPIRHEPDFEEFFCKPYLQKIDERDLEAKQRNREALAGLNLDNVLPIESRVAKAKRAMESVVIDRDKESDGSSRLLIYAKICKGWGVDLEHATEAINEIAVGPKAFDKDWTDSQIARRYEDADILLGEHIVDPDTQIKLPLKDSSPEDVARKLVEDFATQGQGYGCTLRVWEGGWYRWTDNYYKEINDINTVVIGYLQKHYIDITMTLAGNVVGNLKPMVQVSQKSTPCWLPEANALSWNPEHVFAASNQLVNLRTGESVDGNPAYFNLAASNVEFRPELGSEPKEWLEFLDSLDIDPGKIKMIQQYMGLCLSNNLRFQKMLLLLGPTRAGKGIISGVIQYLAGSYVSTNLWSLTSEYGLQNFIGRKVAFLPDVEYSRRIDSGLVCERLKCITAGDPVDVNRKHLPHITTTLPTRLVWCTNLYPEINDPSGVLANRMIPIELTKSFLGKEDVTLRDKLLAEGPMILNWAIEGYQALLKAGEFDEPKSVQDFRSEIQQGTSPVTRFLLEKCLRIEGDGQVTREESSFVDDIYEAYREWMLDNNEARDIYSKRKFSQCVRQYYGLRAKKTDVFGADRKTKIMGVRLKVESDLEIEDILNS